MPSSFLSDRRLEAVFSEIELRLKTPLYLVGGPVRDGLLGRPCHDLDFVCTGAKAFARAFSTKLKATFIVLDEENRIFRVAYRDSASSSTTFDFAELQGKSIDEDLARRDFTINAMAQPLGKSMIIDPFQGQRDLKKRLVRALNEKAFVADPLRLLRAYRFSAQLSFSIEPMTLRWIKRHARLLDAEKAVAGRSGPVARERVREELLRLLSHRGAGATLRAMDRTRLLTVLFPVLEACRRTAISFYGKGGVLKHSLETVEQLDWIMARLQSSADTPLAYAKPASVARALVPYLEEPLGAFPRKAWMKLAGLLHDIGKPATAQKIGGRLRFFGHEDVGAEQSRKLGSDLRLSRQENHNVSQWVRHHMRLGNLAAGSVLTDKAIARYFRDQDSQGVGMILISLADHYSYLSKKTWGKGRDAVERAAGRMLESFFDRRDRVVPPKLVDGYQLMKALRLKPSPLIGLLLEQISDAQAEGKVTTPHQALTLARRKLPAFRKSIS